MPSTTLVLLRHGHVTDNDPGEHARLCGWTDPPLSPLGLGQAHALRAQIGREPAAVAVYASPLRRARDTAQTVADALALPLRLRRSLREIGCGVVDGWPLWRVQQCYPELWAANLAQVDAAFRWPGGESYRSFRARALRAVGRILAAHPGERVIVVTHTGVITQVLGALAGTSAARWDAFRVGNASITELRWQHGRSSLLRFDDRRHLDTPAWGATRSSRHQRAG